MSYFMFDLFCRVKVYWKETYRKELEKQMKKHFDSEKQKNNKSKPFGFGGSGSDCGGDD